MSGSRMGVDPSLAVAGARRTLRRLELEAYASVMTAFRAQGPLTCDKKCSLEQLGKLLGISSERHRAEVRRAVNDELLSAIASCVCLADSEEMWQREGQKLASTNPRFVARQLSHLPHLLTSTTVSNALGLQNAKPDPELRKNTSTQVQNVLKFIISQNPLNSGAATGAKQALGKITLPAGTGKPLAKSPSKLPPSNEGSPSGTANTQVQALSTTPPTSSTASSTAAASKTPVKEEKPSPGSKDTTLVSLPGKGGMSPTGQQPVPSTAEKVTAGKQRKSVSGGKSSMLVGLLEGKKSVCEIESSSGAVSQGEEKSSVSPESDATTTEERVDEMEAKVEEKGERMEEEEEKEKEKRSDGGLVSGVGGGEEMAKVEEEEIQPQEKERCQEKDASPDEEEKVEVKQEEEDKVKEEEKKEERESEKMDVQSPVVGESGERHAEGEEGCEPELVCEEIMPKTVPARDNLSDPAPPSSSDSLILPPPAEPATVTQRLSSPTEDTTTLPPPPDPSDGVAPPLLPDGKSIGSQSAEKVEESEEMMKEEPSLTPAPPPTETQPESSPDAIVGGEKECKVTSTSASTATASDDSGLVSESRKRPLPTDTPLPPSPKKTHLTSPPPNPPQPPPPSPPPPSVAKTSTTVPPSSLPIPPPTTSSTTKPAVQPPPLVFSPLPAPSKAQVVDEGGRKKENSGVSESIFRQVGPGGPVGRVGGVTIQPLLPSSSLSLPSVCLPLHSVSTITKPTSLPSFAPTTQPASVSVRPTPPVSAPPPLLSFPTLTPSPLPSLASSSSITTHSSPLTLSTTPTPTPTPLPSSTSLQLPNEATSSVQKSVAFQMTPTPTSESRIVSDVTMMSSTSDEALIRELCSEAAEDTTAAALASQLGLEFLEPNLLGGLDLMQLVNSPLEEVKPAITKNGCPQRGGSVSTPGPSAEPAVLTEVDTTHLLSEALTSLSNPSTPLLPSSLPPFHPPLFPASSPLVSTESPVQPLSRQLNDATTPSLPPSLITSHSSPFTPHTPQIFTPQTPSLSSPLTPEILPDIEDLASANEADLLEGIPPELAETIQALAQFESPLQ